MSDTSSHAVFLSYASQDAEAARRIAEALRAAGVEVWFDQNELVGGDAWDQKIRRQIRDCALFVPLVSAATQARREGYFRLEWKLADDRTHLMAKGTPFLLPVCIDDTKDWDAIVPDSFTTVQWTRLPGGEAPEKFCARVKALLGSGSGARTASPVASSRAGGKSPLPGKPRRWRVSALLGAAALVGLALVLWRPWRGAELVEPEKPALTESQRLTQQARALMEDPLTTRENLRFADELAQKAVALQVTDGAAVSVQARVSLAFITDRYDTSPERFQSARAQAERAVRLAPDSAEAALALTGYFDACGQYAEAEKRASLALVHSPNDHGLLRERARALMGLGRFDDAATAVERAAALPGGDADALTLEADRLFWDLRIAEADRLLDRALAQTPTKRTYEAKLRLLLWGWGDLAAARELLGRLPASLQLEDVFTVYAVTVWRRLGEADKALETLRRLPREFLEDTTVSAPKSIYAAFTLWPENRPEALNMEATQALALLDRRLAPEGNRGDWIFWRANVLAMLGRRDEARRAFALYEQLGNRLGRGRQIRVHLLLGESEAAIAEAQRAIRIRDIDALFTLQDLVAEPIYRELRKDPRIASVLADGEKWLAELKGVGQGSRPASIGRAPAGEAGKSVAVLAFANLSDDKGNEYFSDGISEELLNVLAKIPGLKVAARTSAFSFKGRNATAEEIGRTLGVATLVDGSVRKAGNSVRITARLSRAATGEQLWSESYTRDLQDVFAVQSEIAATIVGQLRGQLDGKAREEIRAQVVAADLGGTRNVEAHQLYLQGRYFFNQLGPDNLDRAVERLQRAVELDPQFALAWALLSRAGGVIAGFSKTKEQTAVSIALARRGAERALAAEPKLPSAHLVRSQVQSTVDHDWKGAAASVKAAQALAPNDPGVIYSAATAAYFLGRPEEAARLGQQAVTLDPVNPLFHLTLGRAFEALRRFPEAEMAYRRFTELSPANAWAYTSIGRIRVLQGRFDEAVIEAEKGPAGWAKLYVMIQARWGQGKTAESDALLDQMIKSWGGVADFQIAQIYAFRRENDQAFAWLDRAIANDDQGLAWAKADLTLSALHADSRWNDFLRKMGLADEQLK